jgi:hypothetical protein
MKATKGKSPAATPKKEPKTSKRTAKLAKAEKLTTPRADSKNSKILELIGRSKGAILAEIVTLAGWQKHAICGSISTLASKYGFVVNRDVACEN